MFFQILKREIRASHAKILLISLTEIPKIIKSINYPIIMLKFAQILNFNFLEAEFRILIVF